MKGDIYSGLHIADRDAQIIAAEVAAIESSKGHLTTSELAEELVQRAKPTSSPTHHLFEWNDKKAAEAQRLDRARTLIRCIYVVFEETPDQKPIRAFPVLVFNSKKGPVPMRRVLGVADLTAALLEQAKADAKTWMSRYERLRDVAEMRGLFRAIDKITKRRPKRRSKK